MATVIGVISDTHGLMRPEALQALAGVNRIIHAGDIGKAEVLERLAAVAPVDAIRGNADVAAGVCGLRETLSLEVEDCRIFVIHDRKTLQFNPQAEGYACVISGHSHRPSEQILDGVLYLNPGSAGKRRFRLPITLAIVTISGRDCRSRVVALDPLDAWASKNIE